MDQKKSTTDNPLIQRFGVSTRRIVPAHLRHLQGTLHGVKLVAVRAIQISQDKAIQPGTDVTEEAKGWINLPTLLKRGYVKADPEIDHSRLQVTRPSTEPGSDSRLLLSKEQEDEAHPKLPPTIDEVMAHGYSAEEAQKIVVQQHALAVLKCIPYGPNKPVFGKDGAVVSVELVGEQPANPNEGEAQEGGPEENQEDVFAVLAKLTEKDSTKQIRKLLSKVSSVPKDASKQTMLAMAAAIIEKRAAEHAVEHAQNTGEEA